MKWSYASLLITGFFVSWLSLIMLRIRRVIGEKKQRLTTEAAQFENGIKAINATNTPTELQDQRQQDTDTFQGILKEWVDICLSYYNVRLQPPLPVLRESLAARFEIGDERLRYKINSLTKVGLLGTFSGLTIMVINAYGALNANSSSSLVQLTENISGSLSGMGIAFSASLAGLAGSIFFGWKNESYKKDRDDYYKKVLAAASIRLIPLFSPVPATKADKSISYIEGRFKAFFSDFTEAFKLHIERINTVHETSSQELAEAHKTAITTEVSALKEYAERIASIQEEGARKHTIAHVQAFEEERKMLERRFQASQQQSNQKMQEIVDQLPRNFEGLWNVLNNVTEDMKRCVLASEEQNIELKRLSASHMDTIKEINSSVKSFTSLSDNISAIGKRAVETSAMSMSRLVGQHTEVISEKLEKMVTAIPAAFGGVSSDIQQTNLLIVEQIKQLQNMSSLLKEGFSAINNINTSFTSADGVLEKFATIGSDISKQMDYLKHTSDYLVGLDKEFRGATDNLQTISFAINKQNVEISNSLKGVDKALNGIDSAMTTISKPLSLISIGQDTSNRNLVELRTSFDENLKLYSAGLYQLAKVADAFQELKMLKDEINAMSETNRVSFEAFISRLEKLLTDRPDERVEIILKDMSLGLKDIASILTNLQVRTEESVIERMKRVKVW